MKHFRSHRSNSSSAQLYDVIRQRLEALSNIKFAAYRVACKLRLIQKLLKRNEFFWNSLNERRRTSWVSVTYVDYNILVRAFNTHQLQFGVETRILTYDNARQVLIGIYQLISTYHFNEASMDEIVETLLRILSDVLQM